MKLIVGKAPSYYTYPGITMTSITMTDRTKAETILQIVKEEFSAKFNIDMEAMHQKNKTLPIMTARQVFYYFCRREVPKMTVTAIGKLFNQDHSTVCYAIRTIQDRIQVKDPYCYDLIIQINKRII